MSVFVDIDALADEMLPHLKEGLEKNEFPNVCLGFLDGAVRIQVFPPMDDMEIWRDKFLWAMNVLGCSVAMDTIAWVSDSYAAEVMTKGDGSEWEYGDMGRAFTDPNSPDRDRVTEALIINIVDRTGSAAMLTIKYKRQPDGSIEFGERMSMTEGSPDETGQLSGPLVEGLRQAMLQTPVHKRIEEITGIKVEQFGLDQVEMTAHMMCAGVKTVAAQGVPVALGATSERERDIIRDSFANGPQFGGRFRAEEI